MIKDKYYILSVDYAHDDAMMLGRLPPLPDNRNDNWVFGQPFNVEPDTPLSIPIREDSEDFAPLNFYKNPPIASTAFVEALVEAGVDNIIAYDTVLKSQTDPSIEIAGYHAINIIGLVKAAGPGTVYLTNSRLGDASMQNMELEPRAIKGLYMFRLAESMRTIIVHEKVKRHLESKGFNELVFTDPGDALIL